MMQRFVDSKHRSLSWANCEAYAGTSACSNGAFYCENKDFRPRMLLSMFVNDGVCDCCDGSDEPHGCNDVCSAHAEQATRTLREKLQRYERGASERTALIELAGKIRQQWLADEQQYVSKREILAKEVEELNGVHSCPNHY